MELEDRIIPAELDYSELDRIKSEFDQSPLTHLVDVFTRNVNRVIGTITLPLYLSTRVSFVEFRTATMIGYATGSAKVIMEQIADHSQPIPNHLQQYLGLTMDQIIARELDEIRDDFDKYWDELIETNSEQVNQLLRAGKEEWDYAVEDERIQSANQQLLSSIVASTWTVFEVLCSDLWIKAVNDNPQTLGRQAVFTQPRDDRKIDLSDLLEFQLDIRNNLGAVLRKKFKFTDPEKIKDSFASLNGTRDFSFLDSPLLKLLAQVRHIIVHNAGLVDQKFIQATGQALPEGSLYPITESTVYDFVNEVIRVGQNMLDEVRSLYPASS